MQHEEPIQGDILTKARSLKKDVTITHGDRGGLEIRSFDHPLDFYLNRGRVSARQHDAGDRFFRLWQIECQSPYAQARYSDFEESPMNYEFIPPGFGAIRYRAAIASIRGEIERTVAFCVCCEGIPATRAVKYPSRRTAERRGILYLRSALDDLADHFKELQITRIPE